MNPILAKIASLKFDQALIVGALVGGLYYMMFFDDGSSLDAQASNLRSQIEAERTKERESDEALARVQQLRESYAALTDQFRIVAAQIPNDMQMSEIIRTVDSMARTSGIIIKTKEPRTPVREDLLETLPIRVEAEGSYSEFAMFIYNLSTIERIYRVRSFIIRGPQDDRRIQPLRVEAELASYRFASQEGAGQ